MCSKKRGEMTVTRLSGSPRERFKRFNGLRSQKAGTQHRCEPPVFLGERNCCAAIFGVLPRRRPDCCCCGCARMLRPIARRVPTRGEERAVHRYLPALARSRARRCTRRDETTEKTMSPSCSAALTATRLNSWGSSRRLLNSRPLNSPKCHFRLSLKLV
jgi:hypothetical protein